MEIFEVLLVSKDGHLFQTDVKSENYVTAGEMGLEIIKEKKWDHYCYKVKHVMNIKTRTYYYPV